jgi:hypothetical protein
MREAGPDAEGTTRRCARWRRSDAAERSGGDARGLLSAALLVLRPDAPPLDLRIDLSDDAPARSRDLLRAARTSPYADWLDEVPTVPGADGRPGTGGRRRSAAPGRRSSTAMKRRITCASCRCIMSSAPLHVRAHDGARRLGVARVRSASTSVELVMAAP